jgi:hypothetical protein
VDPTASSWCRCDIIKERGGGLFYKRPIR